MKSFMSLFRQRLFFISLIAVFLVVMLFSFANLSSSVDPKPQDLPVAIVMLDEGQTLPDGTNMNFGKKMKEALTMESLPGGDDSPFMWTEEASEQTARKSMERQEYYATIIVPASFSSNVMSLLSPAPTQASVQVIINQGKHLMAANAVQSILNKMIDGMNEQLREQLLMTAEQRGLQALPTAQLSQIASPVNPTYEIVNPIGNRSANGNAPTVLSQMMWMGSMIGSIIVLLASQKALQGLTHRWGVVSGQLLAGAIISIIASGSLLLTGVGFLDLHIPDVMEMWGYTSLIGFCFFSLMIGILNWTGINGAPILALLFFFAPPVLGLPVEFLPEASKNWLYSWVPLRFAAETLRDVLYFGKGLNLGAPLAVLFSLAGFGVALTFSSAMRPIKSLQSSKDKITLQ